MKAKAIYQYQPNKWQRNPYEVQTETVQYWANGVMITLLSKAEARQRVEDGEAFVITDQAIGQMVNGISFA